MGGVPANVDRPVHRPWRGVPAQDRVAERRSRLLEAGLELFGTQGFSATTIQDLCSRADLSRRYLYEAFPNREELLFALAGWIVEDAVERFMARVTDLDRSVEAVAWDAFGAFVDSLIDDPRRSRVLLVETVGISPQFETRRRALLEPLSDLLRDVGRTILGDEAPPWTDTDLTARALTAGALDLLVAHARGEITVTRDHLVLHLSRLFDAAAPVTSTEGTTA